ncbi:ArsR/SmtB family transcription factor [Knoellia koreensis]
MAPPPASRKPADDTGATPGSGPRIEQIGDMTGLRLDATAVKVLAHPLRSRLLSALRLGGPATATDLATRLDTNSGATSYHLRKLESVGLVADTGEGEGKRRLWRAATEFHTWEPSDFADDEDAETALNWLTRDYLRHFGEQFGRWLDVEGSWPTEWRDAAGMGDSFVVATAEQLEALKAEIDEVILKYRRVGQGNPNARRLAIYTASYPLDLDRAPRGKDQK